MFEPSETLYDDIDTDVEEWDDLSAQVQKDRLEWLNATEPTVDDKAHLLKLYKENRFRAWDCPHCEGKNESTRVFVATVEDDEWEHFQGSRNQDFSFFGDLDIYTQEYLDALCDGCRCYAR